MAKAIIFDWGRTLWDPDVNDLFPTVKESLFKLGRDHKLAIVSLASDGDVERRRRAIARCGIERLLSSVVIVPVNKEKAYQDTFKALGVKPEEVIIVDDRVVRGITFGNRLGAKTIWLKHGKFSHELPNEQTGEPTHTIADIKDIVEAVTRVEEVRLAPRSDLMEGRAAKRYDLLQSIFSRRLYSLIASHVKLEPGAQLLDVGCGTGTALLALYKKYGRSAGLYGLDPSPDMLTIAEEKKSKAGAGTVKFMLGGAENIDVIDEAFDWVISSLAFHHLPPEGQQKAAQEVYRILKPGGHFLLADLGRPINWLGRITAAPMRSHSYAKHTMGGSLIAFMKAAGFKDITTIDRHRSLVEIWHAIK